ncbi:kynureninase [Planoprotostelium fungivorum]|uniref:Kynureninase n=1 Tax=Planoprotostelium fungivorum TaxID=1890364 RepID=A0A2P6MXF9_9EUKA|nr:kynureninase [Planoprotostelium fungivorum]
MSSPREQLQDIAKTSGLDVLSKEFSGHLDQQDELKEYRQQFHIPKDDLKLESTSNRDCIYLVGNSLGLQPKTTRKYVEEELKVWQYHGVEGHFNHPLERPWLKTDEYLVRQMERIVGAKEGEVAIMNSLTVNNHLMMIPFYRPEGEKRKILIEAQSFPSDLYGAQSQIKFHGLNPEEDLIQLKPTPGDDHLRTEDIIKVIRERGHEIALIFFSGIQYYTGQYFDIKKITEEGHKQGNVDVQLHEWNVDFATWCSYKYLNGGPGTIAGLFVHSKHNNDPSLHRFAGWWGHDINTRFNMDEPQFKPIEGAFGFRLSNPPVLCVAALLASLEIFDSAGIQNLRNKSKRLTGYLELLLHEKIKEGIKILTPSNPDERGCQLSIYLTEGELDRVGDTLLEEGVVVDKRRPNVIRVAPTPLYNSFTDVWYFVETLSRVLNK